MIVPSALLSAWYRLACQDMAGLNDLAGPDLSKHTLEFLGNGPVQVHADCSSAVSNASLDGSSLIFSPGPMRL